MNGQRRPQHETAITRKDTARTDTNDAPGAVSMAPGAGNDQDRYAAEFAAGYRLGYFTGWEHGWARGFGDSEQEMESAWHAAAEPVRDVLRQPTFAELQVRRSAPTQCAAQPVSADWPAPALPPSGPLPACRDCGRPVARHDHLICQVCVEHILFLLRQDWLRRHGGQR